MLFGIDDPGTVCALQSRDCTAFSLGHGGFQEHHRWPKSMGGPDVQPMRALCASHHVRMHSAIRYLVECGDAAPSWDVMCHFTSAERADAQYAVQMWQSIGSPTITGWSTPAARAV